MSLPNDIIVNHPIYIVIKLFLYMSISMQTYTLNISQTIAVFILVTFFYIEPTMAICMCNSMWNSYVWLFIYFILFLNTYLKL